MKLETFIESCYIFELSLENFICLLKSSSFIRRCPSPIVSVQCKLSNVGKKQRRFQISKKLGVKSYNLFLCTEWLQRNLNYLTVNLPFDFSEIFSIFRITVLLIFLKNSRKYSKKT